MVDDSMYHDDKAHNRFILVCLIRTLQIALDPTTTPHTGWVDTSGAYSALDTLLLLASYLANPAAENTFD